MKWQNKAVKADDPNYCNYNRLVSHPPEKCFVFRDRVMQFVREKKIFLDDEKSSSNQIYVIFGSLNPIEICISEKNEGDSLEKENSQDYIDVDEGLILVTMRIHHMSSLWKESLKQQIRRKMMKKLVKQKSIMRTKKKKVEVHYYQKPHHLVTLEEFFKKSSQENIKASCFNVYK